MTETEKLNKSVALVKKFAPGFQVKYKTGSKLHQIIGWILKKLGNPYYNTSYITTLGQTMYLPSSCDKEPLPGLWQSALHEGMHAKDCQAIGTIPFSAAYLMPQLLGILGAVYTLVVLLGLLYGWPLGLLWGCTSLIFLAPLPAFGRAYAEIRGYTVSLAVAFWSGTLEDEQAYINWLVDTFSGPAYFYMWPFKAWVRSYFDQKLQELKTGQFPLDPYLMSCKVLCSELAYRNPSAT
jgi:hypothetical protein